MQNQADQDSKSLAEVLSAAATELQHAYDRGLRLESAILALVSRNPTGTPDDLNELQHLDMVLQHVSAVGEFLAVIASRPEDPKAIAAAIQGITLGDVRDRLSGANGAGRSNGGELDLLEREDAA